MLNQTASGLPETDRFTLRSLTNDQTAPPVQAIILAAGRGARLQGETRNRPKCLAEVDGLTLIEHQLRSLEQVGIQSVYIVAGYRANQVARAVQGRAAVIHSSDWASSNSLYSLWLCRHWITGPVVVMNCDVLAHQDILTRMVVSGANSFVYDSSSGADDEHMKVCMSSGGYLRAMSKELEPEHTHGENVGILYFDEDAAQALFREAGEVLSSRGRSVWLAEAVERAARQVGLRGIDVSDLPWVEIDFPEDLALAREETWPAINRLPRRVRVGDSSVDQINGGVA